MDIKFTLPNELWEKVLADETYEEVLLLKVREMLKAYIKEHKS